jgi:hypothetical protein
LSIIFGMGRDHLGLSQKKLNFFGALKNKFWHPKDRVSDLKNVDLKILFSIEKILTSGDSKKYLDQDFFICAKIVSIHGLGI